ncbi:GTP pyrophosphokinase family protein [Paenibacillus oenotherae]|uniref:GTP pyrophosphokinase family protein n=1 Tax=Paenibacillus oenotherae TaxID=1435645 RepID=A0ABS7D7J3_9BACL|nr:GTP pyrophosphokinase family protein [Paenibacillus oenotherae]MBW7475846.1 GTP pyrophosphokinase family protein [Paenibacillus oenotherae]
MTPIQVEQFKNMKREIIRFLMQYKFALQELETKVDILKEEFHLVHDYNPIEHTKSRLKSPESILKKLMRKGDDLSLESIKYKIRDIAGLRITCSFLSDIYLISEMLSKQCDLTVLEVKDYIKNPKPNGYQSLHLLVEVPVFMSDRQEQVCVEIQIRTIAMDFWASLEHKIFYKYNQEVPAQLLQELKEAADSAAALDKQMERLHNQVEAIKEERMLNDEEEITKLFAQDQQFTIPKVFYELIDLQKMLSEPQE